ncbi:MAG: formylglycine-generating enzyme family protein [Lentisphaeria bacterium]|nr:formylglycine-generating enzyme family protein [Lentisphaeria bacterium]
MNNTPENTPKPVLPPPDRPPAAEQPSPAAAGHRPRFVIPPRPPATQSQAARPRRRCPKWRYALWATELVILLACLEHFLFKPRRASRQAAAALAAGAAARPAASPEVIRPLADRARALPGLNEVFPAFLAPLDGLAPGSAGMRDTQLLISEQEGLPVEVRNSTGMLFRLVPAGTATIGSPLAEAGRGDIEVPHTVDFPNHFYLGKYEVTQAQWRDIMGADHNPSGFRGDDRPVEEVSWYDCQRFTHLLCQRENVPVGTYRLPTEAEWEYACRAGTTTAYCFGDHPDALKHWADFADNNYRRTSPVGRRRANALGLYDMHGNVWEWCLDEYANYPGDDTPAAEYHLYRNLRGGNWYVEAAECRSANRARLPAASTGNMLGFRVLRMIADPPAIRKTWTPPRSIDLAPETPAAP